ncbi:MAG: secondary thiamine-phosphate synthase enzyme YjbQ [Acidobacteriota bacterium]|jgi:secondary thiamine-phosphate synthase enzyme
MTETLTITADRRGLQEITAEVQGIVRDSGVQDGLCTLFVRHTSASLTIQENADPTVLRDLEAWLSRAVVDGDPLFRHTAEGPDDMSAHVKAALTSTGLAIPVAHGDLVLGTWQGIFLWEHRSRPRPRQVVVHIA